MTSNAGAIFHSPGSSMVDQSPRPPKPDGDDHMLHSLLNANTSNEENQHGDTHGANTGGSLKNLTEASANVPATTNDKAGNSVITMPKKSTASRASDPRLPTVPKSSSVFDRLYKSDTVSSRSHRVTSHAMLSPKVRSKLRNNKVINVDKDLQVFNRLTVSDSKSKRTPTPHKIKHNALGKNAFPTPPKPAKTSGGGGGPPVMSQAMASNPRRMGRYEFSPRMKPVTKLYFISKFHPGVGLESVDPVSLGYTFFQAFCEYESGGMDAPTIAKEILVAFFKKDFPSGRHWVLQESSVGEKIVGKTAAAGTCYKVSMRATYDWDDTSRVARAQGVVRFRRSQKEIRIENYRYELRGDR